MAQVTPSRHMMLPIILSKTDAQAFRFRDALGLQEIIMGVRSADIFDGRAGFLFVLPRWQDAFGIDDKEEILRAISRFEARGGTVIKIPASAAF